MENFIFCAVTIHILANISRSKGNQTNKFSHLVEYKTRNTFLEKLYSKCSAEASFRSFYKK